MKILHLLLALAGMAAAHAAGKSMLIVVGAPGEAGYKTNFETQAKAWEKAARDASITPHILGLEPKTGEREQMRDLLATTGRDGDDLWIVLIGHGTFDGRDAKFNLHGDDLTPEEFAEWLKPFRRRVIVLNFFAASGAFLPHLGGRNRVVLSATRSGGERNYSRLGEFVARSLPDRDTDIDDDGSRSLRELAVHGTKLVNDFYENGQLVVPEHAMLDDNGDGKGTPVSELGRKQKNPDGLVAAQIILPRAGDAPPLTADQRARRDKLEAAIEALKAEKKSLPEKEYYRKLEELLLQLAAVYEDWGDGG